MLSITQKTRELLIQHSNLCAVNGSDYYAGVRYTPDFSYEYDEKLGESVFNMPFHELILKIGVIDSTQDPEERAELGQAYIIPTKVLQLFSKDKDKESVS